MEDLVKMRDRKRLLQNGQYQQRKGDRKLSAREQQGTQHSKYLEFLVWEARVLIAAPD